MQDMGELVLNRMQELTDAVGALGRRFLLRIGNIRATIEIIDVQQQNLQTAFGLTAPNWYSPLPPSTTCLGVIFFRNTSPTARS